MRKLPAKILSFFVLGIIGCMTLFTYAQNTPSGFGDVTSTTNVGVAGAGVNQGGKLIDVVRSFVNWLLGILALIALIILIWGGFQMITAAGDETKYKKGFKILQQAAIGLVFIGVSWLVVSVIFWLLGVI
ncbi:MAG: hypothetical protein WCG98_07005 [bacterium]